MRPQPVDQFDDIGVAPHPCWKAGEVAERFNGVGVITCAAHITIDAVGVGPIRFHRNGRKAFFFNKPLSNLDPRTVELVGAMGRRAEQNEAHVADQVDKRVIVVGLAA